VKKKIERGKKEERMPRQKRLRIFVRCQPEKKRKEALWQGCLMIMWRGGKAPQLKGGRKTMCKKLDKNHQQKMPKGGKCTYG